MMIDAFICKITVVCIITTVPILFENIDEWVSFHLFMKANLSECTISAITSLFETHF